MNDFHLKTPTNTKIIENDIEQGNTERNGVTFSDGILIQPQKELRKYTNDNKKQKTDEKARYSNELTNDNDIFTNEDENTDDNLPKFVDINQFYITKYIGHGSFGKVFQVKEINTGKT